MASAYLKRKPTATPKALMASGLWNHFTGRKKYTITCGECEHRFVDRVPFAGSDRASTICPCCGTRNVWSHAYWARQYEDQF